MAWWTGAVARMQILTELIEFLWEQKLWWMIPMVVVLVTVGMLFILTQNSVIAPFIYTLF